MLDSLTLVTPLGWRLILLCGLVLLPACAISAYDPAGGESEIRARYQQARLAYQQRMLPLARYFVTHCAPLPDRQYLECINGKRAEIAAQNIYPEQAVSVEHRSRMEQQFLEGRMDRKQLRTGLEALRLADEAARLGQDIAVGRYSGRY